MKKHYLKILALTILLGGVLLIPHAAFADNTVISEIGQSAINGAISYIANFLLSFVSWFVTVTGIFLSISINLTMHIKNIYETVTGIKTVWIIVRDISSMFIIFFLLYYSI